MKKLLITIIAALALLGGVYGAAASLSVTGVDKIGSSTTAVPLPGGGTVVITDVTWDLLSTDPTKVDTVTLTYTNHTPPGVADTCSVTLQLIAGASASPGNQTLAGETFSTTVSPATATKTLAIADVLASAIDIFNITAICPG